jgi:hypothetical protein
MVFYFVIQEKHCSVWDVEDIADINIYICIEQTCSGLSAPSRSSYSNLGKL